MGWQTGGLKFLNYEVFMSLKIVVVLANSADPDEMPLIMLHFYGDVWVETYKHDFQPQGLRFFSGLKIFFKIGGPKWPMEQKMVGHFLKWWAQAYHTYPSWHLGCILYLHIDTDTCMHTRYMYIDFWLYSKTCLKPPLKKDGSFEHPKHMLKLMGKKIENVCVSKPVE